MKIRNSRRGFSMVEVLIVAALVGIVMLGTMSLSKMLNRQSLQSTTNFQIETVSRTFVASLLSATAWNHTVNDPVNAATFLCLKAGGVLCTVPPPNGGAFRADDATGTVGPPAVLQPVLGYNAAATAGFTMNGQACAGFAMPPAAGNDSCPFHLTLTWTPQCPTVGVCTGAAVFVQVIGRWTYNPATVDRTVVFNNANYNFQVVPATGVTAGLAPATIICTKNNYFPPVCTCLANMIVFPAMTPCACGGVPFQFTYTAAECGGTLPDNTYVGSLSKFEVCGVEESPTVYQPWEGGGPGIGGVYKGECGVPVGPSNLQVVFRKI